MLFLLTFSKAKVQHLREVHDHEIVNGFLDLANLASMLRMFIYSGSIFDIDVVIEI